MTMEQPPILSIVTPTYNRAHTLLKCYQSLLVQTDQRFEWILVDDGSTDDTPTVVEGFREHSFPMHYIRKENGGKHRALNAAHPFIHGKYVLILDSDDALTPDAVEQVLHYWMQYENDPEIGVVTLLRGHDIEHPFCYAKDEFKAVDIFSYRRVILYSSDACEVVRATVFLGNPFPEFPGERFLAEGAFWGAISNLCKCVYVNKVIYLCEYIADGLTASGRRLRIRNPQGCMCNAHYGMAKKNRLKSRFKSGLQFTCYGFFAGKSPRQMATLCNYKTLMWCCLPFGWLLYLRWKKQYLRSKK